MFFQDYKDEFQIIDKTKEELQEFLEQQGITLPLIDSSAMYCAYAIYDGVTHHKLTLREACSMGYMVSVFYTGMGVSCGTDQYYREQVIEENMTSKYYDLENINNIQERADLFYDEICRFYMEDIDKYAYHRESFNTSISPDTKERFYKVEGSTLNEKLLNLLKCYYK